MSRSIVPSFLSFIFTLYLVVNVLPNLGFSNLVTTIIAMLIYGISCLILYKLFSLIRKK